MVIYKFTLCNFSTGYLGWGLRSNHCKWLVSYWFFGSGPNTRCFSRVWPLLGARKSASKKLKNIFFQDKFYSLKAHAHYFTVFIYLATWRTAKLDIFTHFMFTNSPRCSQSMNSLIYIYSVQTPSCLLWVLDQSRGHTSSYYRRPKKKILYYPLSQSYAKPIFKQSLPIYLLTH